MANTGPDTDDEQPRIMHIRFARGNDDRVRETLAALDRNESPEPYLERVYDDPSELHRVTRPKNLELLQTIVRRSPSSINETARMVSRNVRQVHDNLHELEDLGLLELESEGAGKPTRPTVWYDEISVELPLGDEESDCVGVSA